MDFKLLKFILFILAFKNMIKLSLADFATKVHSAPIPCWPLLFLYNFVTSYYF